MLWNKHLCSLLDLDYHTLLSTTAIWMYLDPLKLMEYWCQLISLTLVELMELKLFNCTSISLKVLENLLKCWKDFSRHNIWCQLNHKLWYLNFLHKMYPFGVLKFTTGKWWVEHLDYQWDLLPGIQDCKLSLLYDIIVFVPNSTINLSPLTSISISCPWIWHYLDRIVGCWLNSLH